MQLLMGELGEDRITEEILQKGEVQAIFADAQEQVRVFCLRMDRRRLEEIF